MTEFTEQRGPSGERRTQVWWINFIFLSAEAILRLDRKDVNGNTLPLQERAEQILRARRQAVERLTHAGFCSRGSSSTRRRLRVKFSKLRGTMWRVSRLNET